MKIAIAFAIITLSCLVYTEAGIVPPSQINPATLQRLNFEQAIYEGAGKACKCMNGHLCHTGVNHEVQCSPSYLFVCCIIPDSEENV